LIGQLLAESILLGVLGGLAGLALAHWGLDALVSLAPANTPRLQDIALEGRVLWFSLALSLATGVGFGLAPALSASRTDVHAALTPLRLGGDSIAARVTVEGRPAPAPGEKPRAQYCAVTAGYFETLRIPLKRGRTFDARDRRDAPAVAVVNEALVAQVFPGQDPLGQKLSMGLRADQSDPGTFEVVGVVGDVHHFGLHVP